MLGLLIGSPAFATDQKPFASSRITVTAKGSGPDVILVPGMTSSPSAWRGIAEGLPGYRYHFVQVKGFAGTPPEANADGTVIAPVADEIARYIKEQRLEQPAVVGHSMGGTIGLMIAARHPQAVSKLMVVDQLAFLGALYGPPGTTSKSVRPTADKLRDGMATAPQEAFEKRIETMTEAMVRNEVQRPLVLADAKASTRSTVANGFHELIVTDLRPELGKITVPVAVLYVNPAGVPLTDEQIDAVYKMSYAGLKDVKLVRVPDSAHFIMSDNQPRFLAELKSFLAGQPE
ncbi:MAG TPA: alpha/beta hydrolase [Sphingomicrobium sp.]